CGLVVFAIYLMLFTFLLLFLLNATATTGIYTLSLHDALPISLALKHLQPAASVGCIAATGRTSALICKSWRKHLSSSSALGQRRDRKSTRLNSSHSQISYAVFCLKKKKKEYLQMYIVSYANAY